jgi:hypothetical protein
MSISLVRKRSGTVRRAVQIPQKLTVNEHFLGKEEVRDGPPRGSNPLKSSEGRFSCIDFDPGLVDVCGV